jgi:hypothetical protein
MPQDRIASCLAECRRLTHLKLFFGMKTFTDEQWNRIFAGAPALTALTISNSPPPSSQFFQQPAVRQRLDP